MRRIWQRLQRGMTNYSSVTYVIFATCFDSIEINHFDDDVHMRAQVRVYIQIDNTHNFIKPISGALIYNEEKENNQVRKEEEELLYDEHFHERMNAHSVVKHNHLQLSLSISHRAVNVSQSKPLELLKENQYFLLSLTLIWGSNINNNHFFFKYIFWRELHQPSRDFLKLSLLILNVYFLK